MSATARYRLEPIALPPARLSDVALMKACGSPEAPEAWEEFVRRFNRFVCLAVIRAMAQCSGRQVGQLDPDTVADLIQDVYVKLLDRSASTNRTFRGENDAAVFVYIGRVAMSVAVDAQRRLLARKRGRDVLSLDAVIAGDGDESFVLGSTLRSHAPTPEQDATASLMRNELRDILGCVVHGRNAERDIRIAEAYMLDGVPLSEISVGIEGLAAGATKSSIRRTGAKVRAELARRERLATLRQVKLA